MFKSKAGLMLCVGLVAGLLLGMGMMVGTLVGVAYQSNQSAHQPQLPFPEHLLFADSATAGKNMAVATGPIYEEAEGLFILDFLTGDLQCWIPNPRKIAGAGYLGVFKANVLEAFGAEAPKNPDYMLVTGGVDATRGVSGNAKPALCVCYVIEGTSGKVAAYSLAFDRSSARTGGGQTGKLILLNPAVSARPDVQRDQ